MNQGIQIFAETEGDWGFLLFELFLLYLTALILHIICTIQQHSFHSSPGSHMVLSHLFLPFSQTN